MNCFQISVIPGSNINEVRHDITDIWQICFQVVALRQDLQPFASSKQHPGMIHRSMQANMPSPSTWSSPVPHMLAFMAMMAPECLMPCGAMPLATPLATAGCESSGSQISIDVSVLSSQHRFGRSGACGEALQVASQAHDQDGADHEEISMDPHVLVPGKGMHCFCMCTKK